MPPTWMSNPEDPLAAQALTNDVREIVTKEVACNVLNLDINGDEVQDNWFDILAEVSENPEFRAMVESETIRRTAQLIDIAGSAIEAQAIVAAQSGLHGYHPQHFGNVLEMLEDALQGTTYGTSKFYNLRTIVKVIVPYCMSHGVDIPENLMAEGNDSKLRYLADYMGPRVVHAPANGEQQLDQQLEDFIQQVVDPETTVAALKEHFPPSPASQIDPVEVHNYVQRHGGYLVIRYDTEAQLGLVERSLGKKAEWHFGTGTEPFLDTLVSRKKGR